MASSITFKFYSPSRQTFKGHKTKTHKQTPDGATPGDDLPLLLQATNSPISPLEFHASNVNDANVNPFIFPQFNADD